MNKLAKGLEMMKMLKALREDTEKSLIKEFKGMNITAPQAMVIKIIGIEGTMKVTEISKEMSLSNSTVSGIIDRLEKKGYVTRVRSELDRRVVNVKLSDSFIKEHEQNIKNAEKWFNKTIENTSEEEIDTILKGFNTLNEIIERNK